VPDTEISTIATQRSHTTIIETSIKPGATVETTEIGTSEPETTTIQQETSMLPARVCTCKIGTHNWSRFTLEENAKRLIENTVIDKKGTSVYKTMKTSAHDGRVSSSAIGWIGIVCICVPFICVMCTDVSNWTKAKQKHGDYLKQVRIVKEPSVGDFTKKIVTCKPRTLTNRQTFMDIVSSVLLRFTFDGCSFWYL
jgi:hypothetical protein